jgi:hypothetical protein
LIDITNRNKAEVLRVLYNNSKPQGSGFLQQGCLEDMSEEDAKVIFESSQSKYFDYVRGRVLKVNLSGNQFDPCLYDRDNGEGSAARALNR